jgi:hypothetical protein
MVAAACLLLIGDSLHNDIAAWATPFCAAYL